MRSEFHEEWESFPIVTYLNGRKWERITVRSFGERAFDMVWLDARRSPHPMYTRYWM